MTGRGWWLGGVRREETRCTIRLATTEGWGNGRIGQCFWARLSGRVGAVLKGGAMGNGGCKVREGG